MGVEAYEDGGSRGGVGWGGVGWGGGFGGRDRLGRLLGALGGFSLAVLGASWAVLGAFWFVLQRLGPSGGSSWGGVGAISARLEAILGCLVVVLGRFQTIGTQAKQARQATQSKTSIGGRGGGEGRGESW